MNDSERCERCGGLIIPTACRCPVVPTPPDAANPAPIPPFREQTTGTVDLDEELRARFGGHGCHDCSD